MEKQCKYRMYEAIIDAGDQVFKVNRIARDEKDFKSRYGGNGEFVRILDVTEDFPISIDNVKIALEMERFGEAEVEAIVHLLSSGYANVVT